MLHRRHEELYRFKSVDPKIMFLDLDEHARFVSRQRRAFRSEL